MIEAGGGKMNNGKRTNLSSSNVDVQVPSASLPATLLIRVRPVDDERPVLVNNTVILVWQGSRTVLDPTILAAVDVDTAPSSIHFVFGDAPCGHLVAGRDWSERIHAFTQQQINGGHVAFLHDGSTFNLHFF
jgi:hypothetical protein